MICMSAGCPWSEINITNIAYVVDDRLCKAPFFFQKGDVFCKLPTNKGYLQLQLETQEGFDKRLNYIKEKVKKEDGRIARGGYRGARSRQGPERYECIVIRHVRNRPLAIVEKGMPFLYPGRLFCQTRETTSEKPKEKDEHNQTDETGPQDRKRKSTNV